MFILRLLTLIGRGGGIRTPGTREGSPVFKTGAINRSTTPLFPYPKSALKPLPSRNFHFGIAKITLWIELQNRTSRFD